MTNVEMVKIRQAFSFLNTFSDNIGLYKKRDIRKATQATLLNRKIQKTLQSLSGFLFQFHLDTFKRFGSKTKIQFTFEK